MPSERENIAIAEVAVYSIFIFPAIYVCIRHGYIRQLGWLYLVIFCGLRIAAGIMGIEFAKHPDSRTDGTWSAILGSIGLSPLLLVGIGLLERINGFLNGKKAIMLALRLLHIPIILGLIVAIIGGNKISSTNTDTQNDGQTYEKAGGILLLVSYLVFLGLAILTMAELNNLPPGEKRILFAVLASLPLIAVRLLYSLLADFKNDDTFNILAGNVTVQLCMAIIEEMICVAIFLASGITSPSYKEIKRREGQMGMGQKPAPQYVQNVA
ncbi:hypothetical protein ACLMJK_009366 [Lecanora helva]